MYYVKELLEDVYCSALLASKLQTHVTVCETWRGGLTIGHQWVSTRTFTYLTVVGQAIRMSWFPRVAGAVVPVWWRPPATYRFRLAKLEKPILKCFYILAWSSSLPIKFQKCVNG